MALYFDYRLQSPLSDPNYKLFEWHNTFPVLAIASYSRETTGQVHLHFEEGEHDEAAIIQRATSPVNLLWHPKKKILLTCWGDGEITSWNDNTKRLESFTGVHQNTVETICWSSNGTRLITGDTSGLVVVWKTDSNGKLVSPPISQFQINEKVTDIVCRPSSLSLKEKELHELAKAAIAGDEAALELFEYKSQSTGKANNKKSKMDTKNIFMGSAESLCFILSGDKGSVYYVNEQAKFFKLFQMESGIVKLMYNQEKAMLIALTDAQMLGQYIIKSETEAKNLLTVKINSKNHEFDFTWIGSSLLAYVSGESIIRILDIDKDENFTLSLSSQYGYSTNESIISVTYSAAKGIIAAGTDKGNVAMWKFMQNKINPDEPEASWQLLHAKPLQSTPIKKIKFGTNLNLICVNQESDAFILSEQKMSSDFRDGLAAVQLGPNILHLAFFKQHLIKEEKIDFQFKGIATAKNHIVVWNGKIVKVYELVVNLASNEKIIKEERGNFTCSAFNCAIFEQSIFTLEPSKVNVRTFQGTVKQVLQFTENEGDPFLATVNGTFLAVGTTQGVVKVYDLSRREAKSIGGSMNLKQKLPIFDTIKDLGISCDGNKVTMTVMKRNNDPDSNLYLWNLEKDSLGYFDFGKGFNDIDEDFLYNTDGQDERTAYEKSKLEIGKEICGRYPSVHHWEHYDPRLLVCEAYLLPNSVIDQAKKSQQNKNKLMASTNFSKDDQNKVVSSECMIVSMFFNVDKGLLVYDNYARGEIYSKLISIRIPYHFFVTKGRMVEGNDQNLEYIGYQVPRNESDKNDDPDSKIHQEFLFYSEFIAAKIMRDFIGMTKADNNTTDALLNFSYYLTIGDMDEAFKAIKLIKKESVWENMAQMCVKSHRVDVAKVCLGNMGNVKGIRLLREEIAKGADSDTQIAIIALNLGMIEEAEKLLINAKRYDLLNKLYQNMDLWAKAIDVANKNDRIHLRNTCYNYAKFCEERNDLAMAIDYFEKSDTHRVEVPRMFLERDDLVSLQKYTENSRDKELFRWWGHYFESLGNTENAFSCYKQAEDNLSLCRLHCTNENTKAAIELCNETNDVAACFHLALHFEKKGNFKEAINHFQRAGAISNAIRICKKNDMHDYLASLAFQGGPQDMLDAARYYETVPGKEDKAVILYHKAGHTTKAIDLAFRANKYAELSSITDGITEKSDPLLVRKVADFFMENEQFDKAVDLLAVTKKVDQALELLLKYNVPITEALAEKLTPTKPTNDHEMPGYYNTLELIGDAAFDQRLYTIAAKKYTEANNRSKAMKALMKSGDTQRVIFFANIQKQREIYIMAANYLQSLDWRKDPDVMKHIINFYTRAKSMESLASFYEACAQVEIDEFQDYDKAMSALAEAYKCLTRGNLEDSVRAEEIVNNLKFKLAVIRKFLEAKNKLNQNSEDGLKDLQQILQVENVNTAIRIGDVYSLLIEYNANRQRWKQAYGVLQEMRETIPESSIRFYVNPNLLAVIHRELGIEYKIPTSNDRNNFSSRKQAEEEDDDDIKDNVGYGTYDD
ncbi:unnamed protein product [Brachionus calyciflorus]|uniref:Uncharacterized protein n=1 Tax=Brachionus calyciflorus TaxID=104777 RepID=A0A813S4W1_9BILA|nr:unnamed protein product [Brachionus calyciflorus]